MSSGTTPRATAGEQAIRAGAAAPAGRERAARGGSRRAGAERPVTTPWGAARVVEELRLTQSAGERRFASLVQLLELPKGERLVRFAYATGGTARRGPVTLRERDLVRLHALLERQPGLRELLAPR